MIGGKQKTIRIALMQIVLISFIVVIFFPFLAVLAGLFFARLMASVQNAKRHA